MGGEGVSEVVNEQIPSDCSSDNKPLQESFDISRIESDGTKTVIEENELHMKCIKYEHVYIKEERDTGGIQKHTEKKLHKDIKVESEIVEITKIKEEVEDILETGEHELQIKSEREDGDQENFVEWDHTYTKQIEEKSSMQCNADNCNNYDYDHSYVKQEIVEGMYV